MHSLIIDFVQITIFISSTIISEISGINQNLIFHCLITMNMVWLCCQH